MRNNQTDEEILTAEASLIQLDSNKINRDSYKTLKPNNEAFAKAINSLQNLGFTIQAEGVVSITISGPKETFERVFHIQFEKKSEEMSTGQQFKGKRSFYYVPIRKPEIPEDLRGLIYDIVFPIPPNFFI